MFIDETRDRAGGGFWDQTRFRTDLVKLAGIDSLCDKFYYLLCKEGS
jgi:hypothetical protein